MHLLLSQVLTFFMHVQFDITVKPVLSGHSKRRPKLVFKTDYRLMQVKSIASAILSTFVKLPFVFKTYVLSIFEWSLTTGFTVPTIQQTIHVHLAYPASECRCQEYLLMAIKHN